VAKTNQTILSKFSATFLKEEKEDRKKNEKKRRGKERERKVTLLYLSICK
jgi:hypothetical protein